MAKAQMVHLERSISKILQGIAPLDPDGWNARVAWGDANEPGSRGTVEGMLWV